MALDSVNRRWIAVAVTGGALLLVVWSAAREKPANHLDAQIENVRTLALKKDQEGLAASIKHPDVRVATAGVIYYTQVAGQQAVPVLCETIKAHPNEEVRNQAVVSMAQAAKSSDAEAVATLNTVLSTDPSPRLRAAAARSLGAIWAWEGLDSLVPALDDKDVQVRECAIRSVDHIIGVVFPYNANDAPQKRRAFIKHLQSNLPHMHTLYTKFHQSLADKEHKAP